jgi:hypothetical protein
MVPLLGAIDRVIDASGSEAEEIALEVYAQMQLGGLCSVAR